MWESFCSKIFTVSITLKPCLAQDGQEIILTPLFRKLRDFNISFPILTSSTGLSDKEILQANFLKFVLKILIAYK